MEKKTRLTASEIIDLPLGERDPYIKQMLRDAIAYHEEKRKEELAARGVDVSNFRSLLSLSSQEVQSMLRERIEYYERLEAERAARAEGAASAGQ
jgi:hypothetical protein